MLVFSWPSAGRPSPTSTDVAIFRSKDCHTSNMVASSRSALCPSRQLNRTEIEKRDIGGLKAAGWTDRSLRHLSQGDLGRKIAQVEHRLLRRLIHSGCHRWISVWWEGWEEVRAKSGGRWVIWAKVRKEKGGRDPSPPPFRFSPGFIRGRRGVSAEGTSSCKRRHSFP